MEVWRATPLHCSLRVPAQRLSESQGACFLGSGHCSKGVLTVTYCVPVWRPEVRGVGVGRRVGAFRGWEENLSPPRCLPQLWWLLAVSGVPWLVDASPHVRFHLHMASSSEDLAEICSYRVCIVFCGHVLFQVKVLWEGC